jgi:hypothetical protein
MRAALGSVGVDFEQKNVPPVTPSGRELPA